jgi:hypothetical protein
MCPSHCTITPQNVRSTACRALTRALPWCDNGRRVRVRRFHLGFSHETTRKAVEANFPLLDPLTDGLVDALSLFGSRALRGRCWSGWLTCFAASTQRRE